MVSDIIFLQKRDHPIDIEPDWVHLGLTSEGITPVSYTHLDVYKRQVKTYEAVKGADVLMQPERKVIGSCPACGSDAVSYTHLGIYVGNGMMIHCGNPISYASIETNYWRQHYYCMGRIR